MITLFGNLESGNVHKVQMILHRLGVVFRRVDVAQTRGEPRRPEYLALNPIGKVPAVLLDDDDLLSESGAILYYFSADTELWPIKCRSKCQTNVGDGGGFVSLSRSGAESTPLRAVARS